MLFTAPPAVDNVEYTRAMENGEFSSYDEALAASHTAQQELVLLKIP